MVGVYIGKGETEKVLQDLEEWIRNKEECIKTIVGEDFNTRIRNEDGGVEGEEEEVEGKEERRRQSKDNKINKKCKMLVELIEERGWMVFNKKGR